MTSKFLVMFCRIFFFCCIIILISCSTREDGSSIVLARVGDAVLTTRDLPDLSSKDALSKDAVSAFIEEWVNDAVLYQSAKKQGLLADEQLRRSRDAYYKKIVVSAFVDSETSANINISSEDVRSYYKAHRDGFYRASDEVYAHLFIAQKFGDARDVRDQLIRGGA